ncbi:hypothetical protein [Litoribacillus peritrichatus]|uniref:Porin n=1 Tax=Litoribacillus peritrichatus TaxID=718191 RepID=A0ABP7M677_9GAMM
MRLKSPLLAIAMTASTVSVPAWAIELDFNGFISVGGGISSNDELNLDIDYNEDVSFDEDSILGIQTTAAINDKMSLTAQLVARGKDDYDLEAEWAFVSYEINDEAYGRAGRLRVPFFAYSESIDVGYSYHWIRPPSEVYRLPFSSIDGVDANYTTWLTDDWETSAQVYFGTYSDEVDVFGQESELDLKNGTGLVLTANYDWLTLRGSVHYATVTVTNDDIEALDSALRNPLLPGGPYDSVADDIAVDENDVMFYEAAVLADYNDYIFVAEWTMLDYDRSAIPDDTGWMISVGKRIGAFTPHLTFAKEEDDGETGFSDPVPAGITLPDGRDLKAVVDGLETEALQESWIAGVRWDVMPSAALKFEAQYTDRKEPEDDDTMIYSVVLDAVF